MHVCQVNVIETEKSEFDEGSKNQSGKKQESLPPLMRCRYCHFRLLIDKYVEIRISYNFHTTIISRIIRYRSVTGLTHAHKHTSAKEKNENEKKKC